MPGDEKAWRGGWKCVARGDGNAWRRGRKCVAKGQEMRGDAGMTTSGRGRDYVATQLALRRDAV